MKNDDENPVFRLNWSENMAPTKGVCSYDHVTAETPFGRILITWKGWKEFSAPSVDEHPVPEFFYSGFDVNDAKQRAEEAYFSAIGSGINHLELLKKYMIAVQKEQAVHMREVENTEVFKTMTHEELVVLWDLESEIYRD